MHRLFNQILDIVYPPRPDELLIRDVTTDKLIKQRRVHATSKGDVTFLLPFSNLIVRAAIHEAKFHHNTHAHRLLGEVLSTWIKDGEHTNYIIVPVPLSKERLKGRGYNQVECILKSAKLPHQKLLRRTVHSTPQTSKSKSERLLAMHNAYSPKSKVSLDGKHILLIDDVTTTGATLRAAKAALLPLSPTSITCLALAH